MNKTICIASLLMLGTLSVLAQQSPDSTAHHKHRFSRGLVVTGQYDFPDLDAMNRTLKQAELPALSDEINGVVFGYRLTSTRGRWSSENMFGFSWSNTNQGRAVNGSAVTYRDYRYYFNILYDVSYRARLTKLFPLVGIGLNYRVLRTYSNLPGNGNFVQLANSDVKRYRLDGTSIPLVAGLSLEQGFRTRFFNLFIGLRGGYAYHALQSEWSLDGDIITNLPAPSAGVPFAALSIRLDPSPGRITGWKKGAGQQ